MRKSLVAVIAIAGCTAGFASAAHACRYANATPSQLTEARADASTVCLINKRRAKHHLRSLRGDAQLWSAAHGHSVSMGTQNFFSHAGDGTPESRAAAAGYMNGGGGWGVGEDLGWGSGGMGSPRAIVSSWMASPVHRLVILSRRFKQIGVGAIDASPAGADDGGTMIYTALLGFHRGH